MKTEKSPQNSQWCLAACSRHADDGMRTILKNPHRKIFPARALQIGRHMNQLWSAAPMHAPPPSIRRHMRCTCTQPAPCTFSISCPGTSRIRRPPTYRRRAHRRPCAGAARPRPLHRRPPCGSTTRRRMRRRPCRPPPRRRPLSPPGAHPTPGPRRRSSAPAQPSPPTPRRRRTCAFRPRRSMAMSMHGGASTANSECSTCTALLL